VLRRMRAFWQGIYEEQRRPSRTENRHTAPMCSGPLGRFANETLSGRTALRLFALGYPEIAESWAQHAAEDPTTPVWERGRAVRMLGYLAEAGVGASESVLVRLCRDVDQEIHLEAEHVLAIADRTGHHRALYRKLARDGDASASEALSYWPDVEAISILRNQPPWVYSYEHGSLIDPKPALARLRAFEDGTWSELARTAILEELSPARVHFLWAIRVGLERRPGWFETSLRARMRKEYATGRFGFLKDHLAYVDSSVVDDLLLALFDIGSELTADERNYLRAYGYLGDPRERLMDYLQRSGW
jgi:hypothetical protein